jgi:putative SOS response-associated peptidase YedK
MCGRFSQAQIAELDREVFKLLQVPQLEPRYNLAPTQDAAVIRESVKTGQRVLGSLRWGLIPYWAKDPAIGNRLINARSETLLEKPAFESAFRYRRCLVPADGFYEWQKIGGTKQPYYLRMEDGHVFAFAALWERWQDEGHRPIETFTLITTEPNTLVEPIHNRMPVILARGRYDEWLDPCNNDMAGLSDLLTPYPAAGMTAYPVSTFVNSPRNEGPACVEPLEP